MQKLTLTTVIAAALMSTSFAHAGGLFGKGGLIRGSIGNALDKTIEKPITTPIAKGVERTVRDTANKAAKVAKAAITPLKVVEDTLIEGKSLDQSLDESLEDIKDGVVAAAESYAIPNHLEQAYTEVAGNVLGKEAGRAIGLVLLPGQVARSLRGIGAQYLISSTESADNLDDVVGIPLGAALHQAKAYYEPKAKPLPEKVLVLLGQTFDKSHLAKVRYIVDSDGGTIAGLINGIKDQMGDLHDGNHAVAIDNIIVFAKEPRGKDDLFFWAHEVQHTVQYAQLGIDGFAAEYTKDYKSLEEDADRVATLAVENVNKFIASLQ